MTFTEIAPRGIKQWNAEKPRHWKTYQVQTDDIVTIINPRVWGGIKGLEIHFIDRQTLAHKGWHFTTGPLFI